ncbi:hypothetical protein PR048_022570 [Dryococelus australis]|uniref:Uncharacterized protein n=1 Tax=Dryococelus australis TaxID=614101 RepID=A0ABQ9H1E4_9NEOP|nr:hypothetical protein PR048_022570 [Dryococelus australis]
MDPTNSTRCVASVNFRAVNSSSRIENGRGCGYCRVVLFSSGLCVSDTTPPRWTFSSRAGRTADRKPRNAGPVDNDAATRLRSEHADMQWRYAIVQRVAACVRAGRTADRKLRHAGPVDNDAATRLRSELADMQWRYAMVQRVAACVRSRNETLRCGSEGKKVRRKRDIPGQNVRHVFYISPQGMESVLPEVSTSQQKSRLSHCAEIGRRSVFPCLLAQRAVRGTKTTTIAFSLELHSSFKSQVRSAGMAVLCDVYTRRGILLEVELQQGSRQSTKYPRMEYADFPTIELQVDSSQREYWTLSHIFALRGNEAPDAKGSVKTEALLSGSTSYTYGRRGIGCACCCRPYSCAWNENKYPANVLSSLNLENELTGTHHETTQNCTLSVRCLSSAHRVTSNHDVFGGQVIDYWRRVEFHYWRSSYLHMVVWVEDHPNFETQVGIQMIDRVPHIRNVRESVDIWATLNIEVLRADEGEKR